LVYASTITVMSVMPIPNFMLSLRWLSIFVSVHSSHSFMLSHSVSWLSICALSILAIRSMIWCSCATSHTCCPSVPSAWLLQSPSMLTDRIRNSSRLSLWVLVWG
jgi:hypothetical protein